jgi:mRNA interferase MazF
MGEITAGAVVLVRFPFSDLTQAKQRPAVVLASVGRGDYVLCQVTSRPYGDPLALGIAERDFAFGALPLKSYVRPGKLFTAHESVLSREIGKLKANARARVVTAVVRLIESGGG